MSINKIPFIAKHAHLFSELEDRRAELSIAQASFAHDLDRVMSPLDKRLGRIVDVTRSVLAKELGRVPSRDVFAEFVPVELAWVHSYHSLIVYYDCRVVDLSLNPHKDEVVLTLRWPGMAQPDVTIEIPAYLLSASEGDVAGDIRRLLKVKELREKILEADEAARSLTQMRVALKAMEERISELESGEAADDLYNELRNVPKSNLMRLKRASRGRA